MAMGTFIGYSNTVANIMNSKKGHDLKVDVQQLLAD
jgi:hypothetical protein